MGSNTTSTTTTTGIGSNKLRVLLIPFFATSHIQPFTELAIRLAGANDAVEATLALTPANVSIAQPLLDREHDNGARVKIATFPFPRVDGIPKGVENCGKAATPDDTWRILAASVTEDLTRPAQETLIREQSPDAIITDLTFFWTRRIADELGVPCVSFSVVGAFTMLALHHLAAFADDKINTDDDHVVTVPRFPAPCIRIARTELPDSLRIKGSPTFAFESDSFGFAVNTSSELEKEYCDMYTRQGYVKRAYFLGPVAPPAAAAREDSQYIIDWLDAKPDRSVVYLSFGSMAHIKDAQLDELALGLETSGESFLWVVRGKENWTPSEGWERRVQGRGFIIRAWAPQTAILEHRAVAAFVMQCGWNSILETVAAGVPTITWPFSFDQFITERLLTDVLGVGVRFWPDGAGLRSGRYEEHELIPSKDVARALTTFMSAGGPGDLARTKLIGLAAKVRASATQGGSSRSDLHRLVDDLMAAKNP